MYRQADVYASSKSSISIKLENAMDAIRQYELLMIKLDSLKHQNKCKKTCQYYYNLIDHSTTQTKREMLEVRKP